MKLQNQKEQTTIAIKTTTNMKDLPKVLGEGYGEIMQYMQQKGLNPAGPPFALYFNEDMENLEMEMGFPIAEPIQAEGRIIPSKLPGGPSVVGLHIGPYTELEQAYNKLMAFAKEQGKIPTGIGYESYLNDPQEVKPEELETEIVFLTN